MCRYTRLFIHSFVRSKMSFRVATDAAIVTPESVSVQLPEQEYWPLTYDAVINCDLSYFNCDHSADMVRDGMRAVLRAGQTPDIACKEINVWKYLSEYSPPGDRGFQFSAGEDKVVSAVQYCMDTGHSGCSMGWTMRQIEFIAKNGLPAHRAMFLDNRRRRIERERCDCPPNH